ncbi:MAG: type I-E CRISPR-associated protein Cse1/CasA [Gammaproteobacteria bacterium]|nr:type I-E CRISPR-associated protein Cse1/CasA [Gammaproteobacteria bacterium]
MNLLMDNWIPAVRASGVLERIAPWQISDRDDPVIEIASSRPDFQGALYQFLIGVLQSIVPPANQDEWFEHWQSPPDLDALKKSFEKFAAAFELFSNQGPAFLQDFDMPDGEQKYIASLLIDAPGGKTLKDNLDHFVKGGSVSGACESCVAAAIFTLQTNAPSGGVGHRVGLRGGGPLTTLLRPGDNPILWRKLWINVLCSEDLCAGPLAVDHTIFPWMAPTRTSEKGLAILPGDVNPLQMFWGMPRRLRLESETKSGRCDLCGQHAEALYSTYRTKNYGMNYEGPWVHPLTPYRFDGKNQNPPLSLKGQKGGLGYRHWLGLTWIDADSGDRAALNVHTFNHQRFNALEETEKNVRLWCFGYDMDNMKARCWYESEMPVLRISEEYREVFISFVCTLIEAAREVIKELRSQVKSAWFNRPADVKGDTSMIDASFWSATESSFYDQLDLLGRESNEARFMPAIVARNWLKTLRTISVDLFDDWTLSGNAEDLDMKRITKARRIFIGKLSKIKAMKDLEQRAEITKEEIQA